MGLQQARRDAEQYAAAYLKLALSDEPIGARAEELMPAFLSLALDRAYGFLVNSQNIPMYAASNRERFVTNSEECDNILAERSAYIAQFEFSENQSRVRGSVCWLGE